MDQSNVNVYTRELMFGTTFSAFRDSLRVAMTANVENVWKRFSGSVLFCQRAQL